MGLGHRPKPLARNYWRLSVDAGRRIGILCSLHSSAMPTLNVP